MKKIKIIISTILLMASATSFAAPIKTINFATEATYPPFEYVDDSGQIKGFDIAIANALCEQLHANCTFTSQAFNSLMTSLQIGKYDAVIASLGVTPEREKQVSFTQSYYQPSASFVAPTAKNYRLSDVTGKTIGVQQGSTFQRYLQDKYKSTIKMKAYASAQDGFLDLKAGRVDLVIVDTPIATAWLKANATQKDYTIVEKPIMDTTYFGSGYGIAVNKNNVELLNALNGALKQIKANGTYDKIVKSYFGTN